MPEERSAYLRTADGRQLHYRAWTTEVRPRAVLLIAHGLGEHSGRYAALATEAVARGISVFALDHRGHGRSHGRRGHIRRFGDFIVDLEAFRAEVAQQQAPEVPMFLLGHSLGGLIALRYLQEYPAAPLRGAIASAPALGLAAPVPRWKRALAWVAAHFLPWLPVPNDIDPADLTHDAAVVADYRQDSLVHRWISPRLFKEMQEAMRDAVMQRERIRVPLLLLVPMADRIVDPGAAVEFARGGNAEMRCYPEAYHECLNEVERTATLADIFQWMDTRIP